MSNNKDICIVGVGTWLPEKIRTNSEWPENFGAKRDSSNKNESSDRTFNDIPLTNDSETAKIIEPYLIAEANDPFLGSRLRHVADLRTEAAQAEAWAATAALNDAGMSPKDVDLVMSNSLVPDRVGPNTATKMAHLIGATKARVIGVDAACASALLQIEVALAYIKSGLAENILITQSHLLSRAFPFTHPAAPGLGDGASAMVISKGDKYKIRSLFAQTHNEFFDGVLMVRGQDEKTDRPWYESGGDFRLGSRNSAQAKYLMQETVTFGAKTVEEVLAKTNYSKTDIDLLLSVHPRGWIPGAIAQRLGLPNHIAHEIYKEVGHLGTCSMVFNYESALKKGLMVGKSVIALYAQGAGFTRAAAIIEV